MTTSVTTSNPVRSDVLESHRNAAPTTRTAGRPSRAWSVAGIGAAVAGIATIVTSSMVDSVYDEKFAGTTRGVAADLQDKAGVMFAFHSITVLGAVLMVVYAAGLQRRLRAALPEGSTLPTVAFAGLFGTAVVSILGSGLDTEFMVPLAQGDGIIDDATGALYNHWIGTIPWLWTLAGLTGLAVFAAARHGAVPRWIGRVSLVLGGLGLLLGISPFEYMAGPACALMLLVTAVGFTVGDKAHRSATAR